MNGMETAYIFAEKNVKSLSFAVDIVDGFSQERSLIGETRVFLKENGLHAFKNQSKYYIFMDLIGDKFTLRIENKYYFDRELPVTISVLDANYPVVSVFLIPNCIYPFPTGSTLIRGRVSDNNNGNPVAGASIKIAGNTVANQSDIKGCFVLYFGALTEDDIDMQNRHRYIKVNNDTKIKLKVKRPNYTSKTETIGKVEEGDTVILKTPVTLDPL